jgi:glycosyltransferase involved in cell wall biosynthesis
VPLASLASPGLSTSLAAGRRLTMATMRALSPIRTVIRRNSRRLVFDLTQRYHDACREYLTRYRPDVVHVITPDHGAVMLIRAAHSAGIPVVYQEVGLPFHPPGFEEVYERLVSVLPLCSQVATLSPRIASEMSRVVPITHPPQVVPLIAPDGLNGASKPRASSGSVCFGFASRLEHLKGPLRLIEAFRIAHRSNPSVELKIAGEGSQRPQIASDLNRFGLEKKCRLVGTYTTLEQRSQFMHDIDVLVLPSLTEGTPNVVIEAMAHSKPVITTDVGGIPDFVSQDVGILVAPENQEALGAAMSRLAGDASLRREMGLAARKKYEQMFSPAVVLPLLTEFYERVIAGHHSGNGSAGHQRKELDHPWFQDAERSN